MSHEGQNFGDAIASSWLDPDVPDRQPTPQGSAQSSGSHPITDEMARVSATPASTRVPSATALTPDRVGRSAWDAELAALSRDDASTIEPLPWGDGDRAPVEIEPNPFLRLLKEWGPVLLAAIAIALFTRLTLVQAYHIPSGSMQPTLDIGDRVVVNRLSYSFGEIDRGQVVVFSTPPTQPSNANDIIKRVIGLPGETIEFRDGNVFVDGLLAQEPYLAQEESTIPRAIGIPGCAQPDASPTLCVVPDDHIFVMGDNRLGSEDSRKFGPIPIDTVVGRAMVRVWPLDNIGQL